MANPNARDTKLIQYLNEAYGKEMELETSLQAHIAMTTKTPYRKRLQDHLKETRDHARQVKRRIRELGGKAEAGPSAPGPDVLTDAATSLTSVASKAVAAAQGPLHALRGTGEAEKMLKNAKTEYHNEFEEIATYAGIESLAETVGDKETAKVAKGIRREEERMAKFLETQISQLAKAVAREEIPAAERRSGSSSSRRRSSSSSRSSGSSSSRSRGSSGSSRSSSRAKSSRSASSSSRAKPKSSSSRSSSSRAKPKSSSSRAKSSSSRAKSSSSRAKPSSSRAKSSSSRAKSSSSRAKSSSSRAKSSSSRAKSSSSRAKSSGSRSGSSSRSRSR